MASNSDWSPFLSYWGYYCKDTLSQLINGDDQGLQYSEGLLNSLCYETDVGCIPRGIKLDSGVTAPRYGNTDNWNRQIQGCYWCVADDTSWNGICCSKECFFYLHDWCIERVEHFTKRRFCRFPGCEMGAAKNDRYCDRKHKGKFDAAFPKGVDFNSLLRTVIRAGPDWYSSSGLPQALPQPKKDNKGTSPTVKDTQNKDTKNKDTKNKDTKNKDTKNKETKNKETKNKETKNKDTQNKDNKNPPDNNAVPYDMKFPTELCNAMVYKTDIGLIPRVHPNEHQLASPYSSSPNWLREINGCTRCGNRSMTTSGNSNFCTFRCYLLFYEWCRRLVESLTGVKLCRNTGCDRLAAEGFVCCNREHTKALEEKYSQVKSGDFERLIALGPNWYRKCDFPKDIIVDTKTHQIISPPVTQQPPTPAPVQHNSPQSPPNMVFSWELTQFLFYCTDIGPIPREIFQFMSPPSAPAPIHNVNWSTPVNLCYWCFTNPIQSNVTCSKRCFYLLNEWIHSRYTNLTHNTLCRVLSCSYLPAKGFDCCNRAHSVQYNQFKEYSPLLKSTEFALGPRWYQDFNAPHIDFYNRDEPFCELTNFYRCNSLVIDGISWPTTEHYFQASKFAGTPYLRFISCLQAPRDAFDFSRDPGVQCWIRTNWPTIKINVMLKALRHKFVQNQDLADILIRTGSKHLYEHTKNDKFWGDGGDYRNGTNKLGELLMVVRGELQTGSLSTIPNNTVQHFPMHSNINSPQFIPNLQMNAYIIPQPQTNGIINEPKHSSPTKQTQSRNSLNDKPDNRGSQGVNLSSNNASGHDSRVQSQGANIGETQGTSSKETNPLPSTNSFKADIKLNTNITVMNELKMEDRGNNPISSVPVFTQGEGKIPLPEDYELQFNFANENSDQQQQTELNSNANQPLNSTNPFCDGFDLIELSEPVADKINPFISVLSAESTQRENNLPMQSPTRVGHTNEQVSNQFCQTNAMQTSTESQSLLLQPLIDLTIQGTVPQNPIIGRSHHNINFKLADVKSQCQPTEQLVISPTNPPGTNNNNNNDAEDAMDTFSD